MLYPRMLIAYGRWTGADLQIKPGEYRLPPAITARDCWTLLVSGKVIQYQVTLPEGITPGAGAGAPVEPGAVGACSLEGRTIPDYRSWLNLTLRPRGYSFQTPICSSAAPRIWQLLQRAHERMVAVLEQEWLRAEADLPYETPYEALIMASIIERETGLPEEREQIAGVFIRRLQARHAPADGPHRHIRRGGRVRRQSAARALGR